MDEFQIVVKKIDEDSQIGIVNLPMVHVQCLGGRILADFPNSDHCLLKCIKCERVICFNSLEWIHLLRAARYGIAISLIYSEKIVNIYRESETLSIRFNDKNLLEFKQ